MKRRAFLWKGALLTTGGSLMKTIPALAQKMLPAQTEADAPAADL